ncbi:glycoside hydrolase family 3 C-terminal domain-containing protein [Caldanaerobius polysaccharolyticus]|uniref:glycoside hydrolase family 3 C-terminal domain-containing protein n=1 Tax=Caldanaerobius polysaccharolyticus TaxID=44256 RepID=UPI00047A6A14|nr:glycoside hydrolase family 3 C-terminal domain-containing protein [Caldanaerobius polysaccharolyticus]
MEQQIKNLVSQMTLEEKASLCSGFDAWHTKAIERLGIPSIMMTDGPHGLRKAKDGGFGESVPATCFPTAACMASSWDRALLEKVGAAIGEECQAEGVSILLGPGVNIKRSPLCGRNFEYYSEDPLLSSELAASFIKGVQSQGVGTSIKHFAANNQEYRRLVVDARVDERTLREIYLASFEKAIKEAKPWTIMAAYNKLNGEYCSQNKYLLTKILREEWEIDGIVLSDWGAVDDRVKALEAGLDLEMPGNGGLNDKKIVEAVRSGQLSEKVLDKAVERILTIVFRAVEKRKENAVYDKEAHHILAEEVAKESIILLKNEDQVLPLREEGIIGVIGCFAKEPRYQGGGSSHLTPTSIDIPLEEIKRIVQDRAEVLYADGYDLIIGETTSQLVGEAKEVAQKSDVVIIFAGLPESYESEGYDRQHMRLPDGHNLVIEEVSKVNKNVIVVLMNGSAIEMPWIDKVKGVFECYLAGQGVGKAIAELLFGKGNPCGKLAETFPKKLSDNPSYLNFPGEKDRVEYREGIFVGYRYYDKKDMEVLFPFGYGLSYTTFDYTGIKVEKKELNDNDTLKVFVKVKNTGNRAGKEIIQLYVRKKNSLVIRPEKELKAFDKIYLGPGEEREISFVLNKRAFAYYECEIKDWYVEEGEYEILVGKSSREILLKETVNIKSSQKLRKSFDRNTILQDLKDDPKGEEIYNKIMELVAKKSVLGCENNELIRMFLSQSPLRNAISFSQGLVNEDMIDEWLKQLNE